MLALVWCGLWITFFFASDDPDFLAIGAQEFVNMFPSKAAEITPDNAVTYITLAYSVQLIIPVLIFSGMWLAFI